ncbi:MAG: PrgI family protein [Candidatus Saccharibacteria bacterium]
MKTTTVPAQVTTVEDKIAGNLNLAQLLLLAASVFNGFALYIIVPPTMKFSIVKILLCLLVMLVFASLAIRIRGKLIIFWFGLLVRYNIRPRYYVFDKNDSYLRVADAEKAPQVTQVSEKKVRGTVPKLQADLPLLHRVRLETAIADPRAKLTFHTTKKGGLNVRITEIK